MRINKYVALSAGIGRRKADIAITNGRVLVNGRVRSPGYDVTSADTISLDGKIITPPKITTTILFNKPTGYVVSREGQGSKTIYKLLPPEYQELKPIGRLDKNSSGLLLLTNDGTLANELTHPSRQKLKIYRVALDKPLQPLHHQIINDKGIQLTDGISQLQLQRLEETNDKDWIVKMHEGRNRQIRRTFHALGYEVMTLHRTHFGKYALSELQTGKTTLLSSS